jgi:predicted metalloprotease
MRWQDQRQSSNVEDRRSSGGRRLAVGGGLGTVVAVVLYLLFGGNLGNVVSDLGLTAPQGAGTESRTLSPEERKTGEFVSVVLADTEDVWRMVFEQQGKTYRSPT